MNTTTSQLRLFTPVEIGPIRLGHRVVMAPLTRLRSDQPGDVPNDLMAEYYGQRATDGGLIITESAEITPDASAYQGAPGIYCDAQVAGWRKVTSAVHAKGGYIFLQLWHSGRVSHVDLTGGVTPVGPSAVPTDGILVFTAKGPLTATPNRALETEEIPGIVEQYRRAAERAKAAGLDGIEILAAGGYLLDQFLQDGANKRTDQWRLSCKPQPASAGGHRNRLGRMESKPHRRTPFAERDIQFHFGQQPA